MVYGGQDELKFVGYSGASFQTDRDDGKSQTGWVFTLNGGSVSWKSSKQATVADSTCESEYIAATEAVKEAMWMKKFVGDLGVVPYIKEPLEIYCDNENAVTLSKDPRDDIRTKHIEPTFHFVRNKVEDGHVVMKRVHTDENPADPFTKPLVKEKHDKHARNIGLKDNVDFNV